MKSLHRITSIVAISQTCNTKVVSAIGPMNNVQHLNICTLDSQGHDSIDGACDGAQCDRHVPQGTPIDSSNTDISKGPVMDDDDGAHPAPYTLDNNVHYFEMNGQWYRCMVAGGYRAAGRVRIAYRKFMITGNL